MTIAWPTHEHEKIRARIAKHRAADEIIQGDGWNGHQGCAIGCSLDRYDHLEYVRVVGVDLRTARAIDWIHERLPREKFLDWPGRVATALSPGADTSLAFERLLLGALRKWGGEQCAPAAALYERRCAGHEPSAEEWTAAYRDALAARAARAARDALAALATLDTLAALAALDTLAALAALAALATLDILAALAALATLDTLAALATLATLDTLDTRDALAARDARDARACEFADSLEEILRSCQLPQGA